MAIGDAAAMEEAVVTCLMKNPDCSEMIRNRIGLDDFSSQLLANCYRAIAQVMKSGGKVEPYAVAAAFCEFAPKTSNSGVEQVSAYLDKLAYMNPAEPSNAGTYADKVRECALLRRIADASMIIATGLQEKRPAIELAGEVQNALSKIRPRANRLWRTAEEVAETVVERALIAAQNPGQITGLKTPFSDFTYVTQGLQAGEMYVIGARPGMGKTAIALRFALDAAKAGEPVLIASLEMNAEQLVTRLLCGMARVSVTALRRGECRSEDFEKLSAAQRVLDGLPIYIDDKRDSTVAEILLKCHEVKRMHGKIGLLVVDYLQITKPSSKGERYLQVGQIVRDFKSLALEMKCPAMILAQVNRNVESRKDKRPSMSDLRESGEIEAEADVIGFLYRDEYYAEHGVKQGEHIEKAELIVAKNRNGETGTIDIAFNAAHTWFEDMTREQAETVKRPSKSAPKPAYLAEEEEGEDLLGGATDYVEDFFGFEKEEV